MHKLGRGPPSRESTDKVFDVVGIVDEGDSSEVLQIPMMSDLDGVRDAGPIGHLLPDRVHIRSV